MSFASGLLDHGVLILVMPQCIATPLLYRELSFTSLDSWHRLLDHLDTYPQHATYARLLNLRRLPSASNGSRIPSIKDAHLLLQPFINLKSLTMPPGFDRLDHGNGVVEDRDSQALVGDKGEDWKPPLESFAGNLPSFLAMMSSAVDAHVGPELSIAHESIPDDHRRIRWLTPSTLSHLTSLHLTHCHQPHHLETFIQTVAPFLTSLSTLSLHDLRTRVQPTLPPPLVATPPPPHRLGSKEKTPDEFLSTLLTTCPHLHSNLRQLSLCSLSPITLSSSLTSLGSAETRLPNLCSLHVNNNVNLQAFFERGHGRLERLIVGDWYWVGHMDPEPEAGSIDHGEADDYKDGGGGEEEDVLRYFAGEIAFDWTTARETAPVHQYHDHHHDHKQREKTDFDVGLDETERIRDRSTFCEPPADLQYSPCLSTRFPRLKELVRSNFQSTLR